MKDLKLAIEAINIRNKIVHAGVEIPKETKEKLEGLIEVIRGIMSDRFFKFPSAQMGNSIRSPENWEEAYKDVGSESFNNEAS